MNLETHKPAKTPVLDLEMDDFDFKPITNGLGFHQQKVSEVKPVFVDTPMAKIPERKIVAREAAPVYQNDLSLFYGQNQTMNESHIAPIAPEKSKKTKTYRKATTAERITAYVLDLTVVASLLGVIMTAMARAMEMDLMVAWSTYPNEITPLVVTLFCGFFLMYFSIFEKAPGSTLGKSIFNLEVLDTEDKSVGYSTLLMRSVISLANFVSLGLFSYFNLQSKATSTKVVKAR